MDNLLVVPSHVKVLGQSLIHELHAPRGTQ